MRQTAKTQVTDVRFAKLAKDGAKLTMATRRRLHRRFSMNSQHVDLMNIVTAMQSACKKKQYQRKWRAESVQDGWMVRLQAHAKRAGASNRRTT